LKLKRFLALLLTVVMVMPLGASNLTAKAETEGLYTYSVSNDEAVITDVSTSIEGDVTIPENFNGYPVTGIGDYAFEKCVKIESITLPNSITKIGEMAFYDCYALTGVYVEDITAWCKIDFKDSWSNPLCYAGKLYVNNELVTDLVIPEGVTSIKDYTFYNCNNLTSITLPESVKSIGNSAFYDCFNIANITIPNSVKSIGDRAFYDCYALTDIVIPDSVISIGRYVFCWCNSLKNITVGNGVKTIDGYAFNHCDSLTSITIPNSVISIGECAFEDCNSLTGVYITDLAAWCNIDFYDEESNPLYYAKKLYLNNELVTDLVIPDGVTDIGDYAFWYCNSITSVTIPESVTHIGSMAFWICDSLTGVYITDMAAWCNIDFYNSASNPLDHAKNLYLNNELVTDLVIPEGVTRIGYSTFYNCDSIRSVIISDSVKSIDMYAFGHCKNLISVTISNSVNHIDNNAFDGSKSIVSITVEDANPNYSSLDGVLFNKNQTTLVYYPSGKDDKKYTIPYSVNKICYYAFSDCSNLESIHIISEIEDLYAVFYWCKSLVNVHIESEIEEIGISAFNNCTNLKSIFIPDTVKVIKIQAFEDCTSLTDVWYSGSKSDRQNIDIKGMNDALENATWHYNAKSTNGHIYDGVCDRTCNLCGEKRTAPEHKYKSVITKATLSKNGKKEYKCTVCGYIASKKITIYRPYSFKISNKNYTYNGKVRKPTVTVKGSDGKIISSKNYTVTYSSGRKNVGKYKVTIKFKGNYSGTKTIYFTIKPPKTTVSSLTAYAKKLKVKITKKSSQVTGYQIQYSTSKKFSSYKTKTVTSYKTTSAYLTGLKAKTTYYVRVRTYKTVNGKKYYSDWSSYKYKKTK